MTICSWRYLSHPPIRLIQPRFVSFIVQMRLLFKVCPCSPLSRYLFPAKDLPRRGANTHVLSIGVLRGRLWWMTAGYGGNVRSLLSHIFPIPWGLGMVMNCTLKSPNSSFNLALEDFYGLQLCKYLLTHPFTSVLCNYVSLHSSGDSANCKKQVSPDTW